jgi:hypothetical protein
MMTHWFSRRWRAGGRVGAVMPPVQSTSRKSVCKPRPVRLAVEELEPRHCPSPAFSMVQVTAVGGGTSSLQVEIRGSVVDSDPGSLALSFSGSGVSASTTLAGTGSFDIITSATSLGNVTAAAENMSTQRYANPVTTAIRDQPPAINNFTASSMGGNYWTFKGQVTDDQSVAGLVVTLGGLPSLQGVTVTTNSQGWFSYTCQLGAGESGTATAQTQDIWGVLSNVAMWVVN